MTKIDIISGFLGSGKTTLIKKLLKEAWAGEQVVLIENEFGEIGIDGGFLKEAGIEIREMNSGCICCSLVGDFDKALAEVIDKYNPDRVVIEPSGVGALSDIVKAVGNVSEREDIVINSLTTVVDAKKCKTFMKNFGAFFNDQIKNANAIILSRTDIAKDEKIAEAVELIRTINEKAPVITTPIDQLSGKKIFETMEGAPSLEKELLEEAHKEYMEEHEHHHHHHHDDDDEECCCGHHHHHDHDDDEDEHEHHHHHHHDDDEECECGHHHHHDHDDDEDEHEHHHHHHDHDEEEHEHHHHHDHDEEEHEHHHHHDHDEHEHHHHHHYDENGVCSCGHHHHHHDHEADDVFTSWGKETSRKYTKEELETILAALADEEKYGMILRAKGMVPTPDGTWLDFDMVPEETEIRAGAPDYTGRLCVIGHEIKEDAIAELFAVK